MQRTLRWDTLTAVAMVVLVAAVVQLAAGATRVGVTFDEPTHVDRTNTWLDDGWYVCSSASLAEGRPDPDDPNSTAWALAELETSPEESSPATTFAPWATVASSAGAARPGRGIGSSPGSGLPSAGVAEGAHQRSGR